MEFDLWINRFIIYSTIHRVKEISKEMSVENNGTDLLDENNYG